jgi:hypothetical protein
VNQRTPKWFDDDLLGIGYQLPINHRTNFSGEWDTQSPGARQSPGIVVDPTQVGITFETQVRDPSLDADTHTTHAPAKGAAYRITGLWTDPIVDPTPYGQGPGTYSFQGYLVNQGNGSSAIYLYSTDDFGRVVTEFKGTVLDDGFLSGNMTTYTTGPVDGEEPYDPSYVPPLYAVVTSESAQLEAPK